MLPQNTHVKVYLRNGFVEEGVVQEWSDKRIVLKSLFDDIFTVLHDPKDIFATKIYKTKEKETVAIKEELRPKEYVRDHSLRMKNLTELHKLRAEEERKRAREALTSQRLSEGVRQVNYADPGYTAQSIYNRTSKKNK